MRKFLAGRMDGHFECLSGRPGGVRAARWFWGRNRFFSVRRGCNNANSAEAILGWGDHSARQVPPDGFLPLCPVFAQGCIKCDGFFPVSVRAAPREVSALKLVGPAAFVPRWGLGCSPTMCLVRSRRPQLPRLRARHVKNTSQCYMAAPITPMRLWGGAHRANAVMGRRPSPQ